MTAVSAQPDLESPLSMRIRGGAGAPRRARRSVLSQLHGHVAEPTAADAALIVSELVTNSVLHADIDRRRGLTVELSKLEDRLRIAVIDSGSGLEPRIAASEPETPGGFGLRVVSELSTAWGVAHEGGGTTRVWCELSLDLPSPSANGTRP